MSDSLRSPIPASSVALQRGHSCGLPFCFLCRRSAPGGFTLLELLIAIAIIIILAAITVPIIGGVRQSADLTIAGSRMRQLALTMHMFAADHDGRFPARQGGGGWSRVLIDKGYIEDKMILVSPADRFAREAVRPRSFVYVSPAMIPAQNNLLAPVISEFKSPSKTFMLGEWHWKNQDYNRADGGVIGRETLNNPTVVHYPDGRRNFVFVDGHVICARPNIDVKTTDPYWGSFNEQSGMPPPL